MMLVEAYDCHMEDGFRKVKKELFKASLITTDRIDIKPVSYTHLDVYKRQAYTYHYNSNNNSCSSYR